MNNLSNIENALRLFELAAMGQANATEEGDGKTANKCYKELAEAVDFLKEKEAILELFPILSSQSIGVQIWAATYLLPHKEKESLSVLEKIGKGDDIHSFNASMTISEWKKGNLNH